MFDYWHVQTDEILFPNILWSKPEQKSRAGKIAIIGGNGHNFRAVEFAFRAAAKTGVGDVKVLVPETLRKTLPKNMTNVIFLPCSSSGALDEKGCDFMHSAEEWADLVLIAGDLDKNSQTAITMEKFVLECEKPLILTRDAIDLLINSFSEIVLKQNVLVCASFSQLQKIFMSVFYPKVLTFSMQLANVVETMHKFTTSFPCEVVTIHDGNFLIADNGIVYTMPLNSKVARGKISPMQMWSGEISGRLAAYYIWNLSERAKSGMCAVIDN